MAKACEEAVPNHTHKIMRASLTKPTGSKSSVLQSIYGKSQSTLYIVDIVMTVFMLSIGPSHSQKH